MSRRLKIILTWIAAAAIFYYIFQKYPPARVIAAAAHLNVAYFATFAVVYFFFMWFLDCLSMARLFTLFGFATRVRELAPIRFASYLLMIVNYVAAQALMAYFFKRQKGVAFFKSSSLVLFTTGIDFFWTATLAGIGSLFLGPQHAAVAHALQGVWIAVTAGFVLFIAFWRLPLCGKAFAWLRSRDLAYAFKEARAPHYLVTLAARLPMHLALNATMFCVAPAFGVSIPLGVSLAFSPVVILIGTIPVTPGGLGSTQVAAVELFSGSVNGPLIASGAVSPAEVILAMSLLTMFANYFLKALMGAFFVKRAMTYIPPGASEVTS